MTARGDARFAALADLDLRTVRDLLELWGLLDLSDLQGSFESDVFPDSLAIMSEAQAEAAGIGSAYVGAEAAAQGSRSRDVVDVAGFAGVASDGRPLSSLLAEPFIRTLTSLSAGAPPVAAMQFGAESLDRIVTTQIQDAGRTAEAVAITANREIKGYLRAVEPGACSRCIILAGRFYRFNEGFDRHPKCRCHHSPFTREVEPQSDREIFDGMSTAEQDRVFTKDGAEAIRLGAEPNMVVNARRGMSTAQGLVTTTEGTSKRGLAYSRLTNGATGRKKRIVRLMPESILKIAAGDRTEAIRLLKLHGFIL